MYEVNCQNTHKRTESFVGILYEMGNKYENKRLIIFIVPLVEGYVIFR